KNKVAPPFKQVEFDIMYGEGISKTGEILDLGVKAGIVDKSGAWFSYEGERLGQGRENSKTFLKDNPKIANEIEAAVRESAGLIEKKMLVDPTDEDKADNAITEEQVEALEAPALSVNEPLEKPVKARKRG
ncbi:MAG: DNA recombination/repair protein RecA, partial [Hyphomicrobiaceae bacterium]